METNHPKKREGKINQCAIVLVAPVTGKIGTKAKLTYPLFPRHRMPLRASLCALLEQLRTIGKLKRNSRVPRHSDISTTSNIYAHLDFNSKIASANEIIGFCSTQVQEVI